MSRRRKPTAILEAAGAFKHDPARGKARANEPKPSGPLGEPPPWLSELAVQCWTELVCCVPYPLTSADGHIIAMTCDLEALIRTHEATAPERNLWVKCLGKLGMTPADRSCVQVKPTGTGNEFADC